MLQNSCFIKLQFVFSYLISHFPTFRRHLKPTWLDCLRTPTCVPSTPSVSLSCPRTSSLPAASAESVLKLFQQHHHQSLGPYQGPNIPKQIENFWQHIPYPYYFIHIKQNKNKLVCVSEWASACVHVYIYIYNECWLSIYIDLYILWLSEEV